MSSHYSMIIQWSDEDSAFIVSLPEFGEGCKTHGASYAEAVKNGEEALELLIETFRAEGRPLPEPAKSNDSLVI
jgi:predicted RNase H-like HicB family nuclease